MERTKQRAEQDLREKARVIATQFLAIRTLMAESQEKTTDYQHLNPVLLEKNVNQLFGSGINSTFKELCENSKSPDNQPNSYEALLMESLNSDPSQTEAWSTAVIGGQHTFTYMIPIYAEESCFSCHNDDITGWSIADVNISNRNLAGAISLSIPMKTFEETIRTDTYVHLIITGGLIFFFIAGVCIATNKMVAEPLFKLRQIIAAMAQGNLTQSIAEINGPYEIKVLADEFKIMAEKLKGYYQELEEKVADRTNELRQAYETLSKKQQSLKAANEELQKANKVKSEFLASVSHELKTPLTSIMAFNELLLEGETGELQREFLMDIRRSSHQLLCSINDVLDMAKLEAGRMELELSVFVLSELAAEVIEQVSPVALMKNQRLVVNLSENLPPVEADYRKVEQVLRNLLGNAVKFTPNGGLITLEADYCSENKKTLVSVTDTGPGIRKEDQGIIFDAFRQVNGSSTREHKGSGLGLALAKKLVEMHGCHIWVESTYGQGSKFTFTIPVFNETK